MKIQTRILLALIVVFSLFAIFAVWSGLSEIRKEKTVFEQKVAEKGHLFDEVMELKGASSRSQATDYTFWDEMVRFAERKLGKEWGVENIEASLSGFKDNAAWVYDTDISLVYSVNNLGSGTIRDIPISADAVRQVFADSRFCHFFAMTDLGVMEIFGATIHPTGDPRRLTSPRGYFFVGTLWDESYIGYFSRIFEGEVKILPVEEANGASENLKEGTIYFTKTLYNWDKTPLVDVRVESHSESLRVIYAAFKQRLIVFGVFALVIMFIIVFTLLRWVNRPLRMIWDSLENDRIDKIVPLEKESTEYGMIAKLIRRSFEQKESLESEIAFRKLAEEQLRYSKDQMELLYHLVPSAIFTVDKNRRITSWNNMAAEMTGYEASEIIGRECTVFAEAPCKEKCGLYSDDITKPIRGRECIIRRKDGQLRFVLKNGDYLKDPEGKIIGGIESFEDITERRHAEKKLEEWSKTLEESVRIRTEELQKSQEKLARSEKLALIGQLSSQVSHELRTPLTAIKNAAYLINMQMDSGKTDKIAEYVDLISKEVDVTTQVISNTLGFAKRKPLERKESDINTVLRESLQVSVVPANISVKPLFNEALPHLNVDPVQIRQVFDNIIKNAVDAMPEGGELEVKLTSDMTYLTAEFKDTGVGISKENMNKIFDPLFSTSPRGTGLGLPVCQQIVESHGGLIDVESVEGKGAVFKIKLPLRQSAV